AWRITDSLIVAKVMSFSLSGNFREELIRSRIVEKLGADCATELFPDYPSDSPTILGQRSPSLRKPPSIQLAFTPMDGKSLYDIIDLSGQLTSSLLGSNSWAIGQSRSVNGHPLLANDPHLGVQSPSTWYIVRIEAPGLKVIGASIPGI